MPNPANGNPRAAMLVIGDEILSGRTRDANMHYLAGALLECGIDLLEVRVVADEAAAIIAATRSLSRDFDHVFTSGGIGPTHDDITATCIARAFDTPIEVRKDAHALLSAHYDAQGLEFNAARQRMARIPDGAELIDNPVSVAPGFSLGNVHVLAGVPQVFQAMLAGLLPKLTSGVALISQNLQINWPEGEIAGPLGEVAALFPDLSIGSYPFYTHGKYGANIVVRGAKGAEVSKVIDHLVAAFEVKQ